ncbi:MAG: isoleucine--tRNA ligase [Holosporaceae bacterium]|jgi:isoleucyl-tRNA synthetase|nr:isoleucine--tRNA ligase [Holosporaceae bacterium]
MSDHKDTIFLPKTSFQMRGNLAQKEPEILEHWSKIHTYDRLRKIRQGKPIFVLHDGPPFANGTPHAGTAMNKVIKDFIVRLRSMQGFDAPFVPGWDCHGLPIEWKIEEQLREKGQKKGDIPVAAFRDMCCNFANHWIDIQRQGFKRLGIGGDWENPYLTMAHEAEACVIRQIGRFIIDGTLYRGEKPVFWSVVEQTALADAEIEYLDKKSSSIYVAFRIKSLAVDFLRNAHCVIWTTTPWSIPGNRAISYSKDMTYCLMKIECNGKTMEIVLSRDLVGNFLQTTGISGEIVREFSGKILGQTVCLHPFHRSGYDFDVPLIHGDHVDVETGTGLVHTAPGHGIDDFNICKKFNIGVPNTVNEAGIYYDEVPMFAGKHVFKVDEEMLLALTDAGALLFQTTIQHSYPHSWRSKAPLIFRTTPQWFISMDGTGLRQKALAEIEKSKWIPKQGYNRIKAFVANRSDWCLSRQRVWGVPLPLFISKKTGEPLRDPKVIDRIADVFALKGANAWFASDPQIFLGDLYRASEYEQVMDTLDVWFESASTHAYVLKQNDPLFQADMYVEGSDQHRGWFQHSLLNSCGTFGNAPFKAVMTHGFIVDEKGRKMSKSLGNIVTLDDVVKNLGADIFRMWVACSDFTQDLKLGTNILKQLEDVYRKLRNTLRYMLGALSGYKSEDAAVTKAGESVFYADLPDLEKWALHRLTEIHCELMSCIEACDINKYFMTLHMFCSNDLSSFFFDIRKDCLYCDHHDDPKRKGYRYVLNEIFQHVIRWLAPIIVFTAEEAWLSWKSDEEDENRSSVHLKTFLTPKSEWIDSELCNEINKIKEIRRSIMMALEISRKNKIIGSSLQAHVEIFDSRNVIPRRNNDFWAEISITSGVTIRNEDIPKEALVGDNGIGVIVSVAAGEKCERCWKISTSSNGEKVCERCQRVLKELSRKTQ